MKTVINAIASVCSARSRCFESGLQNAFVRWEAYLSAIERELLPSGSGFDAGTAIDRDASNGGRVVLHTSFHHMDEHGSYCGWTEHKITIKPDLALGFTISVSGKDRNGIKDYIADTFNMCLSAEMPDRIQF